MATNRFKSHFATATTGAAAAAFTNANTGTDKIVVGMTISNITNIAQTASVYVHSNSESKLFSLVTDASIPAGGSLVPVPPFGDSAPCGQVHCRASCGERP